MLKQTMMFAVLASIFNLAFVAPGDRMIAVSTPAVHGEFVLRGWAVSSPVWKPDSSRIIFDKPGNVDFSEVEKEFLSGSPDTQLILERDVRQWMLTNGWTDD